MRIRITGTRTECDHTCTALARVLTLREISDFYPNRGRSELGRVYLDIELSTNDGQEG